MCWHPGQMHAEDLLRVGVSVLRSRRRRSDAVQAAVDPEVLRWRAARDRARRLARRGGRGLSAGAALVVAGAAAAPAGGTALGSVLAVGGGATALAGWRVRRRAVTALGSVGGEPAPLPLFGSAASSSLARLQRAEQALGVSVQAIPPHLAPEAADVRAAAAAAAAQVRELARHVAVLERARSVGGAAPAELDQALSNLVADLHETVGAYERLTQAAARLAVGVRTSAATGAQLADLADRLAALAQGEQEAQAVTRRVLRE